MHGLVVIHRSIRGKLGVCYESSNPSGVYGMRSDAEKFLRDLKRMKASPSDKSLQRVLQGEFRIFPVKVDDVKIDLENIRKLWDDPKYAAREERALRRLLTILNSPIKPTVKFGIVDEQGNIKPVTFRKYPKPNKL